MKNHLLAACVVACGLAVAGMFVFLGIRSYAAKDRVVVVKGLSTRDVQADYVIWPLTFGVESNDLPSAYADLNKTIATVREFMLAKGFAADDLRQGNTTITDNWANYYGNRPEYHYKLSTSIVVSTAEVERVIALQGSQSELLSKGIIVNSQEWDVDYQYNGLNELKPQMIEEATKNARAVARKFADDADCSLGSIHHAAQGQFSVESDRYQPWLKHVRVVTTVGYYLN